MALIPQMLLLVDIPTPLLYGNYRFEYVDSARKFDTGSYNLAGIYALGASIQMFLDVGIEKIASHVLMLTDRLVRGLRDKGYRIVSSRRPGEASGSALPGETGWGG